MSRRLRWPGLSRSRPPADPSYLRLASGRTPSRPFEVWLTEELAGQAETPRHLVVARLAERWFQEEIRRGAAALDIGLWGPGLFRRDVERSLRHLEGDLVVTLAGSRPRLGADVVREVARSRALEMTEPGYADSPTVAPEGQPCR